MYKNLLILPDGTEIFSGVGTTNAIRSVRLTELVNSGTELILGSVCADLMEASLFTPGGGLELTAGDEVKLFKVDDSGSRTQTGVFILESPTRPTADTMKLYGYSRIIKLDKDLSAWLSGLTGWPYSLRAFAQMVCAECGLTLNADSMINADFPVLKFSVDDGSATGRKLMQWIGEVSCRFARANAFGEIEFGWYSDSGVTLTPGGENYYFAGTLKYENYEVAPIDAVRVRVRDAEESALWPSDAAGKNAYIITGNPLWSSFNDTTLAHLHTIENALSGMTYTPCRVALPARLDIHAGSTVKMQDRNGREIRSYVMQKTNYGQKDTLECTGSQRRDSTTAVNNKTEAEKQAALKGYADSAASSAVNRQTQEDIFNRLTNYGEVQGFYIQDGKLYINAEFVQIVNLIASVLKSTLDNNSVEISGAHFRMLCDGVEAFHLWNSSNDQHDMKPIMYIYGQDASGMDNQSEMSDHHLKIGGTSVEPTLEINCTNGIPKLRLKGDRLKTLSWKDNGDGTYTLIGS